MLVIVVRIIEFERVGLILSLFKIDGIMIFDNEVVIKLSKIVIVMVKFNMLLLN